jgi:guanylate kinase
MQAARRGRLVVISAPSGAGKTTIAREILRRNPSLGFSVSATTRPRREGEVDGRDYHFLDAALFRERTGRGEFVEWEEIFGNLYGTLRSEVDGALAAGKHLLFDVDVKGGLSIKRAYPEALLIFIPPPSVEVLEARLRGRRTEDETTIARRLARVPMELEMGAAFDHRVVNDVLEKAINAVQRLVHEYLHS